MQSEPQFISTLTEVVDLGISLIGVLIVLGLAVAGVSFGRWLFGRELKLGSATVVVTAGGFWLLLALTMIPATLFAVAPYFSETKAVNNSDIQTVTASKVETETAEDSETPEKEVVRSKPIQQPNADMPAWTQAAQIDDGNKTLVTIPSKQFATIQEAESDAIGVAVNAVKEDVDQNRGSAVAWEIPVELVKNHCIRQRYVETIHRDFGLITADMYRVYLQVELSTESRAKFADSWQSQIVGNRLWVLGSVAGLLTLIFGTVSSYFRLNSATNGAYRKRLKLAAASVVAGGGAIAWTLLPPV